MIEFSNVSKKFTLHRERGSTVQERLIGMFRPRSQGEEFWAVRDVSFRVDEGQSLGLVGHNGAGKSTILKLMTRILEPTSGRVSTVGRVAALLELGSGFHPDLTGRENVFLYGSLMGFSRRDMQNRLEEIVDFANIDRFIDTEVKHYSSGMYTRLAFAVATAVDPDILITDEVLAVGDEAFQRKCMERIYGFRRAGKTIIFVSHALEVVRSLCDIAVWLDHGTVQASGPASQVIDAYLADVNRQEREEIARREETEGGEVEVESFNRRGSREIEITSVEMLDKNGQQRPAFQTHEPLTIRIHYCAREAITEPVFGVGLHTENGIWITGPNTRFDSFSIPLVEGQGHVDYTIPNLPLLTGRYPISIAVVDNTMLHTFDHHDRAYTLVVQSDGLTEQYGIATIPHQWQWSSNGVGGGKR
jgi:ABC-type polysaccharide/polyol phosphate transport system ATPase subunit